MTEFVLDERFTIEYIEREAWVLLAFCSKKRKKFTHLHVPPNMRDIRILRRWGLISG
jgi:hypothetical protein